MGPTGRPRPRRKYPRARTLFDLNRDRRQRPPLVESHLCVLAVRNVAREPDVRARRHAVVRHRTRWEIFPRPRQGDRRVRPCASRPPPSHRKRRRQCVRRTRTDAARLCRPADVQDVGGEPEQGVGDGRLAGRGGVVATRVVLPRVGSGYQRFGWHSRQLVFFFALNAVFTLPYVWIPQIGDHSYLETCMYQYRIKAER